MTARTRKPIEHGTIRGWWKHRHRNDPACHECRKAKADYERALRAKRLAARSFRHATHTAWDSGCRCDECTAFHRAAYRAYMERVTA